MNDSFNAMATIGSMEETLRRIAELQRDLKKEQDKLKNLEITLRIHVPKEVLVNWTIIDTFAFQVDTEKGFTYIEVQRAKEALPG